MVVNQGDVYWIDLGVPVGSAPGYLHPYVVIQNNDLNSSRINTFVVCALTSNLKRQSAPGNVLLQKDEANLVKQSVVNVSQLYTVDRDQLGSRIGTLSARRVRQILDGVYLILDPDGFDRWED